MKVVIGGGGEGYSVVLAGRRKYEIRVHGITGGGKMKGFEITMLM